MLRVWDNLGGKAGLRETSIKFLTLIAAGGRKGSRLNPICTECGELRFVHSGDRANLCRIDCLCEKVEADEMDEATVNRKARKRAHGEMEAEILEPDFSVPSQTPPEPDFSM